MEWYLRLESTGNVLWVLLATVLLDLTSVELLVEDLLGVLLRLFGCV